MNKYKYNRGSKWRKWDLHAHTPLDHEWIQSPSLKTENEKRLFAQQYVKTAIDSELAVIAITDHNFCNNSEELLIPYLQEAAIPNSLTILPGFELTVSDCGGTHVLVIFPEYALLKTIDEIVSQLFPPGSPRFRGKEVLPSKKNIEELNEILTKSKLDYLIIFAHSDRENGVLHHRGSDLRAQLWKQQFVKIAQLSKPPIECTGFISTVVDGTNPHYSRPITYVIASDCRSLDPTVVSSERRALGSRFTWIKADPTFEGLKQIIFEPSERISFQEHEPEKKSDFLTINQVKFLDSSGTFQSDPIPLNANLVTIIGGKSTGKSLLLSCIAQTINSQQAQSAVEIAQTNLYDFKNLDFEVTWSSGDVDKLSESQVKRPITFIPQMYIHRLVEQKNRFFLSESLLDFLRQNTEFEELYQELVNERDTIMTSLTTEVSEFFTYLSTWRDIVEKIDELGSKKSIEDEMNKITKESEELRKASGFTETETETYKSLQNSLSSKNTQLESERRLQESASDFKDQVTTFIQDTLTHLSEIVEEVSITHELEVSEAQTLKSSINKLKLKIQNANTEFIKEISVNENELTQKVEKTSKELRDINSKLKPYLDKIKNQKNLKELQESTKQFSSTLKQISSYEKEKIKIEKKYRDSVNILEGLITKRFKTQEKIVQLFNNPTYSQIDEDTLISASILFDENKFNNDFLGCFDLRVPLSRLGKFFKNNTLMWKQEKHVDIIIEIFHKLIETSETELKLHAGQSVRNTVDMLLRDYLSYNFTVKQIGEDIFKMSPGKQGLILLEIYLHLSNSRYPILIDQPEDNLDNRTIYSHLVSYIKKCKKKRQIILVTHNPNLVLGTDAEQIIVANQDGQGQGKNEKYRFEYVSEAIECSFIDSNAGSILNTQGIREHVCHVLEGGRDAFRQREEKYGLT